MQTNGNAAVVPSWFAGALELGLAPIHAEISQIKAMLVKSMNGSVTQPTHKLTAPLTPDTPEQFPQTLGELISLNGSQCNVLIQRYGIQVPTNANV